MLNAPPSIPEKKPNKYPYFILIPRALIKFEKEIVTKIKRTNPRKSFTVRGSASDRKITPTGIPIIEPIIRYFSSNNFMCLRITMLRYELIIKPNNAHIGIASLMSTRNERRDRATSWNPKPLNPWVNEAIKIINAINR